MPVMSTEWTDAMNEDDRGRVLWPDLDDVRVSRVASGGDPLGAVARERSNLRRIREIESFVLRNRSVIR